MTMGIEMINRAGEAFYDFSLGMLIQSSVLILVLLAMDWLIRKRVRAVVRYGLWMLVLVKLVLPPSLCMPTGIGYWCAPDPTAVLMSAEPQAMPPSIPEQINIQNNGRPNQMGQVAQSQPPQPEPVIQPVPDQPQVNLPPVTPPVHPAETIALQWQAMLLMVWLAGVLVLTAMLIQRYWFVRALIAQSHAASAGIQDELDRCRRQMGLARPVELRISDAMLSPAACRMVRPIILLPQALLLDLNPSQLRSILIHELAHIQRGDLWVNCIQTLLQIVYFYNPLLWLANTLIGRVREKAVDETVLTQLGDQANAYSATLIDIAELAFARPRFSLRLVGIVESKHALKDRIKHIVSRPLPGTARIGIVGLFCVFIVAALLLPMARSQKPSQSDWQVTLPNGDSIELVGVGKLDGQTIASWWTPEGMPQPDKIEIRALGDFSSPDPGYCFFLKTQGDPDFKIEAIRGAQSIFHIDVLQPANLTGCRAPIPDRLQNTHLRLAIATGIWQPLHTSETPQGSTAATINGKTIVFAGVVNGGADTIFSCSDELGYREATRIVAVDSDGRELAGTIETDTGVKNIRQRTIRFTGVAPEKIASISLQSCPYEYHTFKNVPLRPSENLTARISDPSGTSIDSNTNNLPLANQTGDWVPLIVPEFGSWGHEDISYSGIPNLDRTYPRTFDIKVPKGTVNIGLNKPVFSSLGKPVFGELSNITAPIGANEPLGEMVLFDPGLLALTIDLESEYDLQAIVFWHAPLMGPVVTDVIVQVSNDPDFKKGVTTLFNNDHDNSANLGVGRDKHYIELPTGMLVNAQGHHARFVRLYSNGEIGSANNRIGKVQVYAVPVESDKTDTSGNWITGVAINPLTEEDWETFFAKLMAAETEREINQLFFSDLQPGRPAPGLTISLEGQTAERQPVTRQTVTDAQGGFNFGNVPDGSYLISADLKLTSSRTGETRIASGRTEVEFGARYTATMHRVKLQLDDPGALTVSGRVVDAQGKPMPGVVVTGTTAPVQNDGIGETEEQTRLFQPQIISGVTNAEGVYELAGFKPANLIALTRYLANGSPGPELGYKFFVDITARSGDWVQTGNTPKRIPLVSPEMLDRARRLLQISNAFAVKQGEKPAVEKTDLPVPFAAGQGNTLSNVNLILDHPLQNGSLDVRVNLIVRGEPIKDHQAVVRLLDPANRNKEVRRLQQPTNGLYRFDDLPPGAYRIMAYWDAYPSVTQEVTVAQNENKELTLDARTDQIARIPVAGKLLNKRTGRGIVSRKLIFTGGEADNTQTGPDGAFTATVNRAVLHQTCIELEPNHKNIRYLILKIDNHIDEKRAGRLEVHIDPENPNNYLEDPDGDGIFCDKADCTICRAQVTAGPVDFEGYFPDSEDGAKTLQALWTDRNRDRRDANEILSIVRNGLRHYPNQGQILSWLGNLFIWGKDPQNQQAIELMLHASGSPKRETYGDAVYFGLSVAKEKTPAILGAMVAVAMKTDDYFNVTGRILWGSRGHEKELIGCLDPYLNSTDPAIRAKARDVKDYFTDSKAFMDRLAQQKTDTVRRQYGDKLDGFKQALLTGDSATRKQTLQQLQGQGIMAIVDDAFLDAFAACLGDESAEVRATAARTMGGHFVWSANPQNQRAIDILTGLLNDPERSPRTEAVYYGLSTVNTPNKELLEKTLATILDDREINYYGRVIWGARRNTPACIEILKAWMDQSGQNEQRALKAYEIYEDVTGQPLPTEYATRFAGRKSNAHEGLVAVCYCEKPVTKESLRDTFISRLTQAGLLNKVMDFYILESRESAAGLFTCATLADRNSIRAALAQPPAFMVAGYIDGKIGPTGSGWLTSLESFRKSHQADRIALPGQSTQNPPPAPTKLQGIITCPDGAPAVGAQVSYATSKRTVRLIDQGILSDGNIPEDDKCIIVETNPTGFFNLGEWPDSRFMLVATHASGWALVNSEQVGIAIKLQPWGRIEGALARERSAVEGNFMLSGFPNSSWREFKIDFMYDATYYANNRFTFDRLPAGWYEVGYLISIGETSATTTCRTPVEVVPGQVATMTLGGDGRTVVGRFIPPAYYTGALYFGEGIRSLSTARLPEPRPDNYNQMTATEQNQWYTQWHKSPAYQQWRQSWQNEKWRQFAFKIDKDGSFRIDDVPPGDYSFYVTLEEYPSAGGMREELGGYYGTITVPAPEDETNPQPFDAGDLVLKMRIVHHIGDPAPLFEVTTVGGETIRLADLRGKVVLLDFWFSHLDRNRPKVQAAYEKYRNDPRLVIIGFNMDPNRKEMDDYLAANPTPWPQVYHGSGKNPALSLIEEYGEYPPVLVLIGPDGKLLSRWLELNSTSKLQPLLDNTLAAPPSQ